MLFIKNDKTLDLMRFFGINNIINKLFMGGKTMKDCVDCIYYNTDRDDMPCCRCWDFINFEQGKDDDLE